MSLITFDWSQIAYIGSPLVCTPYGLYFWNASLTTLKATPWWAEANIAVGFVFFFCEFFRMILTCGF